MRCTTQKIKLQLKESTVVNSECSETLDQTAKHQKLQFNQGTSLLAKFMLMKTRRQLGDRVIAF